jgi:hypothetical protein
MPVNFCCARLRCTRLMLLSSPAIVVLALQAQGSRARQRHRGQAKAFLAYTGCVSCQDNLEHCTAVCVHALSGF